jgi:uncharacterized repeat protein (TIGR03803 family)
MATSRQQGIRVFGTSLRGTGIGLALAILCTLIVVAARTAQAQTYRVIHNLSAGPDGANPRGGLTMDRAGNLYGTAGSGGTYGAGTVFKLSYKNSVWVLTPLYEFAGGTDGVTPSGVVFGPDGSLYGTTYGGGERNDNCFFGSCGIVFRLRPPATVCKTAICYWTESVLYRFTGGSDGANPENGNLVFDGTGNLYGTTAFGGTGCSGFTNGCGTVFELQHSGGGWTENVVYRFTGGIDGQEPIAGVTFDPMGKLYGTTAVGGNISCGGGLGCGTIFQLTPSGSGWTKNTIYTFEDGSDGYTPYAGLIFDSSGNLYGATYSGGSGFGGAVFELTPSMGHWTISVLYGLSGVAGPFGNLAMDTAGNLYGTTYEDGANFYGNVFKLTPAPQPPWTYTSLHDFTGGNDGANPESNVLVDANGNLYGTTYAGGQGVGVVWEITPH